MIAQLNDLHHYQLRPSDLLKTPDEAFNRARAARSIPETSQTASGYNCVWELSKIREDIAGLTALVTETQAMVSAIINSNYYTSATAANCSGRPIEKTTGSVF